MSALRPPKKKSTLSGGQSSMDSDCEDSVSSVCFQNRRRASMTYSKPFGTRDSFQRRSLQDFSGVVNRTLEEEQEVRRRQAAFLLPGYSLSHRDLHPSLSSESDSDSTNTPDVHNEEWKQVCIPYSNSTPLLLFPWSILSIDLSLMFPVSCFVLPS